MTLFDISKPGARAIRSSFGGGWIVGLTDEGRRVLTGYFGREPGPLPVHGHGAGYIVEPYEAGDLAEHLRSEGIAWEVTHA